MGIRSKLDGFPAETLGGLEDGVSPLEMANAYATIASGGIRNRPTAITRVTFPDGHTELPARWKVRRTQGVRGRRDRRRRRRSSSRTSQSGTGDQGRDRLPAGRQDRHHRRFTDAWFVGFTPRLATAVWVGYPNDRTQMLGLYHGANVAGGTFPAEIWGTYMNEAKGKFCGDFTPPKTPFQSQPFFGEYATGGGKGDPTEGGDDERPRARRRRRAAPTRRRSRRTRRHPRTERTAPATRAATTRASTPRSTRRPRSSRPATAAATTATATATAAAPRRRADRAGPCTAPACGWYKSAPSVPRPARREACGKAVPGSTTSRIRNSL